MCRLKKTASLGSIYVAVKFLFKVGGFGLGGGTLPNHDLGSPLRFLPLYPEGKEPPPPGYKFSFQLLQRECEALSSERDRGTAQ